MSNLTRYQQNEAYRQVIRTHLEQLVAKVSPQQFERIERVVLEAREAFDCPYVVQSHEEFNNLIYRYLTIQFRAHSTADYAAAAERTGAVEFAKAQMHQEFERLIGGPHAAITAERNSINGYDRGFVGVVDALTDKLIQQRIESYLSLVFWEDIPGNQHELRYLLAQALLDKYASMLFPNEPMLPWYVLGGQIEQFIKAFATTVHTIRKQWRQ